MSSRTLAIPAFVLLAGLAASAQTGEPVPAADRVIDKYTAAIGGREAAAKVTTRIYKGTLQNTDDGSISPVEVYVKAPDKYLLIVTSPDSAPSQVALNSSGGWTQNPDEGLHDMSRSDLAAARRDHDLHWETKLKDLYPTVSLVGSANVGDRAVWVLDAAPAQGEPEKLYFDKETGLLLKRDFQRVTLEDGITQYEAFYENYKDADGLKLPFTVRRVTPDSQLVFQYTEIRTNIPIDDVKFQKPAK